jgi:hypothetical protein
MIARASNCFTIHFLLRKFQSLLPESNHGKLQRRISLAVIKFVCSPMWCSEGNLRFQRCDCPWLCVRIHVCSLLYCWASHILQFRHARVNLYCWCYYAPTLLCVYVCTYGAPDKMRVCIMSVHARAARSGQPRQTKVITHFCTSGHLEPLHFINSLHRHLFTPWLRKNMFCTQIGCALMVQLSPCNTALNLVVLFTLKSWPKCAQTVQLYYSLPVPQPKFESTGWAKKY